jgi:alcohol dehydrogenase class IV
LNAVHGIAYAVAGLTHRSHGTTNAVMLPYVLGAPAETRRHDLLKIARMFDIAERDEDEAIRTLCHTLGDLIANLGILTNLRAPGIEQSAPVALTRDALGVVRLAKAFPVPDVARAYEEILLRAFRGDLGKTPTEITRNGA